jgi:hypothetical protein
MTSVPILITSCYSPELRDCTVVCASPSDCAEGQICGSDRLCADPSIAGRCGLRMPGDASASTPDAAGTPDASVPVDGAPDEATLGALTITFAGKGRVDVQGLGRCNEAPCLLFVPLDTPVALEASADNDWRFDEWTTSQCPDNESRTCTFTPSLAMTVSARFRKD